MRYFLLGICAGIIITGLAFAIFTVSAFSIICAKNFARWEEEQEETEEDLIHDEYQDLW